VRHGGHRRHRDGDLRERPVARGAGRHGPYPVRIDHQHSRGNRDRRGDGAAAASRSCSTSWPC
jgi:hypothetical protein